MNILFRQMLVLATLCLVSPCIAQSIDADILLSGGIVIDGSGNPGIQADVAISKDQIVAVGSLQDVNAKWTIDCKGLIICPGFIDLHNHSDSQITKPLTRAAVNYITQGCTTIVTGNCGSGPVDTGAYYSKIDEHGAGPNVAHLIPQGSLRKRVLGSNDVQPTDDQMSEMLALADKAMQDGAWGMSTGLIYVPSSYASTEEITALAKVVSQHGGIYASHIRGEGTGVLSSVDEAMTIGRDADVPVHISHFKSSGRNAWGLVREAARMIASEREKGRKVTADQYPYIASSTSLGATLLPSSARAGGNKALAKRLNSEEDGPGLRKTIQRAIELRDGGEAVRIAAYNPRRDWVGKSLAQIATLEKRPPLEIAAEIFSKGDARIVNFSMNEEDVRHIMAIDWVATASDGRAYLPGSDKPHPRNYGTFPRKLAYYSIAEKVLPLPAAVRSMTSLPAEILGLKDRGRIATELVADIVVFNSQTLSDEATFDDPHQYCNGIEYLFVNGVAAVNRGKVTGALAGKALRHNAKDSPK